MRTEIKVTTYAPKMIASTGFEMPWTRDDIQKAIDATSGGVAIDIEHATETDRRAHVMGWCDLEARDDGLYATNIKWRRDRHETIKRYRFLSVAVLLGGKDQEKGESYSWMRIIGLGLTNEPTEKSPELFCPIDWDASDLQKPSGGGTV